MTTKPTHGPRGRPALPPDQRLSVETKLRMTAAQAATLEVLGGQPWLRARLDAMIAPHFGQDERPAFEAWARREDLDLSADPDAPDRYEDAATDWTWQGWRIRSAGP